MFPYTFNSKEVYYIDIILLFSILGMYLNMHIIVFSIYMNTHFLTLLLFSQEHQVIIVCKYNSINRLRDINHNEVLHLSI